MAFSQTWDETKPANADPMSSGDDEIRAFKIGVRERAEIEHDWPSAGTGGTGRHKFPFGNTAGRPATPPTGAIYFNTQTGNIEQWDGAAWTARGLISDASKLPLAGGTLSGNLILNNNLSISIKDAGGVAQRALTRTPGNQLQVGELGHTMVLQASTTPKIAAADVAGGLEQLLWHAGNDGSGSGLDADLLRGLAHIYADVKASAGYHFFSPLAGIFFQWGSNSVGSNTSSTVTLPIAYGTAHYQVIANVRGDPSFESNGVGGVPSGLSQLVLYNRSSLTYTISWISIGY